MGVSKSLPLAMLLHGAQRLIHDCRPSRSAGNSISKFFDEHMTLIVLSQSAIPKLHVSTSEPLIAIARHLSEHFYLLWYSDKSGRD